MSRASGLTNVDRQVVTFYWWVLENNSLSSEKSPLVAGIFHPLGSQGPISLLGILCKENLPRCSTEPRILKLPFPLLSKASSMVGNVNLFGKMFSDTKPAGCHVWLCCCVTCTWSQVGSSRCCGVLSSLCSPVCIVRSEVTSLTAHLQALGKQKFRVCKEQNAFWPGVYHTMDWAAEEGAPVGWAVLCTQVDTESCVFFNCGSFRV